MTGRPYDRSNSRAMIKQRAITALGKDYNVTNHTFRATGITRALDEGKSFELVQEMANHQDSETTKLYDRTRRQRLAAAMDDFDYDN